MSLLHKTTMITVEVCIDSFESAKIIAPYVNSGDHRVELCGNLVYGGGLTPSVGLFKHVATIIPASKIMVMIRPRPGSFVYTDDELETIEYDIGTFRELSAGGFVLGCLQENGEVDVVKTQRLVDYAQMPSCRESERRRRDITFHRAFDITPNAGKALDDVLNIRGVTRILTSGHAPTAVQGAKELSQLIQESNARHPHVCIVPASGVNASTITDLKAALAPLKEVHLSASRLVQPVVTETMEKGDALGFGLAEWKLDEDKFAAFWALLES